jgi:hypothetical protein
MTPTNILLAAADTARALQAQGATVTGSDFTRASFKLEGTTRTGARIVVAATWIGNEIAVERQVGRGACKSAVVPASADVAATALGLLPN